MAEQATQVKRRRGTASQYIESDFVGAIGEFTYDMTNKTIRVHDGETPGGFKLIRENNNPNPETETTKCKITYDSQGLIVGGENLAWSDVVHLTSQTSAPTGTLATLTDLATKLTANEAITAGTYPKITFDTKGLVTGGQSLVASDIPDISSVYSPVIAVVSPTVSNNTYALEANKLNKIELSVGAAFSLPSSAQIPQNRLNQILVQLKLTVNNISIDWGTTTYISDVAPDISAAGYYNVYYEWNEHMQGWSVNAVAIAYI